MRARGFPVPKFFFIFFWRARCPRSQARAPRPHPAPHVHEAHPPGCRPGPARHRPAPARAPWRPQIPPTPPPRRPMHGCGHPRRGRPVADHLPHPAARCVGLGQRLAWSWLHVGPLQERPAPLPRVASSSFYAPFFLPFLSLKPFALPFPLPPLTRHVRRPPGMPDHPPQAGPAVRETESEGGAHPAGQRPPWALHPLPLTPSPLSIHQSLPL